jgi:ECF sigma factor
MMTGGAGDEITELLLAWRSGDEQALEKLTPRVYSELHQAARRCMRKERDGHTLQTTALINELYLRLLRSTASGLAKSGPLFRTLRPPDAADSHR